jgi:hypothetical protein
MLIFFVAPKILQKWKKFGEAANSGKGPEKGVTAVAEEISFELKSSLVNVFNNSIFNPDSHLILERRKRKKD